MPWSACLSTPSYLFPHSLLFLSYFILIYYFCRFQREREVFAAGDPSCALRQEHHHLSLFRYYPPNLVILTYSLIEKTDVYGYGLMMWEILTMEPLFPHIKARPLTCLKEKKILILVIREFYDGYQGKEELTKHVLAGQRPTLKKNWPASLKELLTLSWHEDAKKRFIILRK